MEDKYIQDKQDRLAVGYVAQAELDKARAIEKAEGLRAGNEALDLINEEHNLKIAEAKAKEEQDEKDRLVKFHNQKQVLEDELAMQKSETDLEKAVLAEELRFEKDQEQLQKDLDALYLQKPKKPVG